MDEKCKTGCRGAIALSLPTLTNVCIFDRRYGLNSIEYYPSGYTRHIILLNVLGLTCLHV